MKNQALLFASLIAVLILGACSPFEITRATGQQPTPVMESSSAAGYQPVQVDQVRAEVGVGSPIPVQVIVSGTLPDTCAQIELMQQRQEGSTFKIALSAVPSSVDGCVRNAPPFTIAVPLNIVNAPAGPYSVEVNGSRADFSLETGNTGSSLPVAETSVRKDDIQVDSVNVEIGVGSPIPVRAIVGLSLPDTCAQLSEIRLHRDGRTFYVRLIAGIPQRPDCKADSLPFRLEVPLNILNLPEGPYQVNVNGVTASFDPRTEPAGTIDGPIAGTCTEPVDVPAVSGKVS